MKTKLITAAAVVACSALSGAIMTNGGFEINEPTGGGHPSSYGDWGGDLTTILGSDQGINPHGGQSMIRFDATTGSGPAGSRDSDLIQLIDLSAFSTQIAAGTAVLEASIWVNRISSSTDSAFFLRMRTYNGGAGNFPTSWNNHSAEGVTSMTSDADGSTWEQITLNLNVPVGTTYMAFWTGATENIQNDTTGLEFEGHYADDATLNLNPVPEPATIAALGIGALALIRRRKSK